MSGLAPGVMREATIDDVGGILAIIQPLEEDGTLVKRDRALIEAELDFSDEADVPGSVADRTGCPVGGTIHR